MRPFRFGLQVTAQTAKEFRAVARSAENAGFDVIHTADHVGHGWPPLTPLMAAADVTTRLRIGPLVVNSDFYHPVHLARELASMDQFSGGRLEVGLGAGHAFTEYTAIGQRFDPPSVRKQRLSEAVEIIRRLLDRQDVTFDGAHYHLEGVRIPDPAQTHVPIMVAANGRRALTHAAQHADIIGLTMLGRTLEDGQRHEVRWEAQRLDRTVAFIREQAGARADQLELNALVQRVVITNDRSQALRELLGAVTGLTEEDARATPFLAIGTHDEIAAQLGAARERWGISYFSVRDMAGFAPVIDRLRAVRG